MLLRLPTVAGNESGLAIELPVDGECFTWNIGDCEGRNRRRGAVEHRSAIAAEALTPQENPAKFRLQAVPEGVGL